MWLAFEQMCKQDVKTSLPHRHFLIRRIYDSTQCTGEEVAMGSQFPIPAKKNDLQSKWCQLSPTKTSVIAGLQGHLQKCPLTFQLFWVWDETQFSFERIWLFYWNHCLLFLSLRLSFSSSSKFMQTCQPHHPSLLRIAIVWAPEITYDRPIQSHSFEVSCLLLLLASFSCSRKDSQHISMENVI